MPRPTKPLAQQSPKARANRAEVQKACPLAACCVACGTSQQLTRSHILTVKQHPHQAANPLNVLTECIDCHMLYEHNKPVFARRYPEVWAHKIDFIRQVAPGYLVLLLDKVKRGGGPVPTGF